MDPAAGARQWWGRRRLLFNAALVAAGMASLTLRAARLELSGCAVDEHSLTPFTLVFQALVWAGVVLFANLGYSLAQAAEIRLQPKRPSIFRAWTFGLGLGIFCALPFVAPLASRCA